VRRYVTLTGLAMRELWISFRLLVVVGALVLAAVPTALLPHDLGALATRPTPLEWFAMALAVAVALAAGLAAAAIAGERRRGSIGWLTTRAVPRPLVLLAWFTAFALLLILGLVPSAALAWLSLGQVTQELGGIGSFVAPMVAAWAAGTAAVALGMLLGSLLPPAVAGLLTLLLVTAALLPAAAGLAPELGQAPSPGAGLAILAGLFDATRPVADSLRSGGASLVAAAALLVAGSAALARADL
jgi:ABC-type transport system involved in multi-copper enzyme maturation permease subunit